MAIPVAVIIAAGAAASVTTTAGVAAGKHESNKAKDRRDQASADADMYAEQLKNLQNTRQDIVNPYEDVTNEFANLSVATQAAEMQAEEADIALANTLDTIRATGGGAGGATALAQAALKSKRGISANIEQQEAGNEKLRAQGAMEAAKLQAAGKAFVFQAQEQREMNELARTAAMMQNEEQKEMYYEDKRREGTKMMLGAITGGAQMFGSIVGGAAGSDRRLKRNIKLIGYSPNGFKIYTFEYINKEFGEGVWQGVMSDEIPKEAVIEHPDGYDRVDYSKLDVTFKKI
ncbi:hypothetical protein CMI37_37920 [Candidatus Pacearchaeota archaeon]|nr:hypothetical protein [Candidatus Pacearchaeota archaeon]|tara:strand:+ start:571 stop:1437 length:867 start_codon:yes stop_codon:yes gene_type:complete